MYNSTKFRVRLAGAILLLLGLVLGAEGQQQECLFVQFDKSFYVSGETIWFKVYLVDDTSKAKSRVLHIDLVSHQNETITQQKLLISNRSSHGNITLPIDCEEGFYRFRAYTHYNLNFKSPFIFETSIPIYQPEKQDFLLSDSVFEEKHQPSHLAGVSIKTDKDFYKPRDSLTVTLQIKGSQDTIRAGDFSLSVVPLEIASAEFKSYNHSKCDEQDLNGDQLFATERLLLIEGKLQDPNTELNVQSVPISIYMEKASQLFWGTSTEGKIRVPVLDYWGPGIFQIHNLDPYNPTVLKFIPESQSKLISPYYNLDQPTRTPVVIKYMEQLKNRRKIIELFDLYKSQEIEYPTIPAIIPDAVYQTKGYKQIYSLEQFINEAITNVMVRTVDSAKSVRLFDMEMGNRFMVHPWYIVDGFLTFDEQEILNIQYQDITEVRLYSKTSTLREYFKPFMWRSGVMEIITRDVKYARKLKNNPNVVEIEGFSVPQNFNSTLTLSKNKATPDLRGVIYWSPNVFINEQGQGQITIPLSDDTGNFAIVVMGTTNFNKSVTGYSTFEIKMD